MIQHRPLIFVVALALVASVALASCSYSGPSNNPVDRRLTYFSFLAADDIRTACAENGAERYRFIYNAEYSRQVRFYEVTVDLGTGEGRQVTRVLGGRHIGAFQFGFENWLLEQGSHRALLAAGDLDALRGVLKAVRFAEVPPGDIELWSDDYYWLVSACVGGRFHQNGYTRSSEGFATLGFAKVLAAHDGSGIGYAEPPPGETRVSTQRRRPLKAQETSEGGAFVYVVEP